MSEKKCSHTEMRWITDGYYDWDNEWVDESEWAEFSTTEDIDLMRYRCTQCGEEFYYSKPN